VKESLGDYDESLMCLDVGCGYGAIVPDLLDAGVRAEQIYGLDLSAEMIRNAETMYAGGGPTFEVASFYDFTTNGPRWSKKHVGAIIFCSSLHDLPDIPAAIRHAASLLHQHPVTPSSTSSLCRPRYLVLVHAQGAQHVVTQMHANPVLVPRPLPDETELRDLAAQCGMRLVVAPAAPATPRDVAEGYLAVLETLPIGEAAAMPPPPPPS
jgi:2-polyprenyl-3-methyl-5-hydroxy-6-metoxy-1,4-benzoquinol methylase